jgi:hypothetical protein
MSNPFAALASKSKSTKKIKTSTTKTKKPKDDLLNSTFLLEEGGENDFALSKDDEKKKLKEQRKAEKAEREALFEQRSAEFEIYFQKKRDEYKEKVSEKYDDYQMGDAPTASYYVDKDRAVKSALIKFDLTTEDLKFLFMKKYQT